jgi:NADH dehydrogenase
MNLDADFDADLDRAREPAPALPAHAPVPPAGAPAPATSARRVVIVGAGFAGLHAAKALRGTAVQVTVLDRANHHLFQPLLYQVATAVLDPSAIAVPIRHVLRAENVRVLLTEVTGVDLPRKRVLCSHGEVPFDDLVLAAGATHSYFGNDDWAARAPGLKTIDDALEIRRRILGAFELAEREGDPALRAAWLTFVVVGGGATGVELAGALAEIARQTLPGEFANIDPRAARVVLVEGQDRLLATLPAALGEEARRRLELLGVEVRTGAFVTAIDDEGLTLGATRIAARTVLWGAGVQASPVARALGVPLDRSGRVVVTETLAIPGRDDVFVVGDLAHVAQGPGAPPVPGVAPAAMQEGRHVARNIRRKLRGAPLAPFRYRDRGSFAVIGRGAAVGLAWNRVRMRGLAAWLAWIFVHLAYLIGFRSRLAVLLDWSYSFVTFRRKARLITSTQRLDAAGRAPPGSEPRLEPARPL